MLPKPGTCGVETRNRGFETPHPVPERHPLARDEPRRAWPSSCP